MVRNVTSPSLVSTQSAAAGCQFLIAQKPPTTSQISGGRPGASVRFLTVIASADPAKARSVAAAIRTSLMIRMHFLQGCCRPILSEKHLQTNTRASKGEGIQL